MASTLPGWYKPNKRSIAKMLKGREVQTFVARRAVRGARIVRGRYPKRTGQTAASATPSTQLGGFFGKTDRWTGVVTVKGAAPTEFGYTATDKQIGGPGPRAAKGHLRRIAREL